MKISKKLIWKDCKDSRQSKRLQTEISDKCIDKVLQPINLRSTITPHSTSTTRIRKQASNLSMCKKTFFNLRTITKKSKLNIQTQFNRADIIKNQLDAKLKKIDQETFQASLDLLEEICQIGNHISDSFYCYQAVQFQIKALNERAKISKSPTLQFYCYAISGAILYEYASFSLTIFYFDRALKSLTTKKHYKFDQEMELHIYKYSAKVFLHIKKFKQAKDMAYMYLRKAWKSKNMDQQFSAYDLLGIIELEDGNIQLSRYFHWRMCHAVREEKEILQISNQELEKKENRKMEFSIFQDIMQFVRSQDEIVSILSNHFRSEAEQEKKGFVISRKSKQIFMYTHQSPNRVLRNHRILQRRLLDQKSSSQLHFIQSKDIKRLRKILGELNELITELIEKVEKSINDLTA